LIVGICPAALGGVRPDLISVEPELYHLRKVHRKETAGVMRRRFLFERSSPI
jgi:hypothetical protein